MLVNMVSELSFTKMLMFHTFIHCSDDTVIHGWVSHERVLPPSVLILVPRPCYRSKSWAQQSRNGCCFQPFLWIANPSVSGMQSSFNPLLQIQDWNWLVMKPFPLWSFLDSHVWDKTVMSEVEGWSQQGIWTRMPKRQGRAIQDATIHGLAFYLNQALGLSSYNLDEGPSLCNILQLLKRLSPWILLSHFSHFCSHHSDVFLFY